MYLDEEGQNFQKQMTYPLPWVPLCAFLLRLFALISVLQVIPQWIGHCSGLMLLMVDPLSHSFGQVHVIPNHSPLQDDQHIPQWMPPSVQNRPITQRDHHCAKVRPPNSSTQGDHNNMRWPLDTLEKVTTSVALTGSNLALSFRHIKAFIRIYNLS